MAKEIKLDIWVDEKGQIHVTPEGTQGGECLNVMQFLHNVKGFSVVETTPNDDMKEKKVQRINQQKLG